jgi:CDP-diacylglycerol--glycerol-3-phosphate 3-phosphatidyltransferase
MSWKWLPNALTIARCILAFGVAALILKQGALETYTILPFLAFVAIAATDFVDGYAARKLNAVSALGAFLDPVADKILVAVSLLALSYNSDWSIFLAVPTAIIIVRDIAITIIRLIPDVTLPVTKLAKWKTALEMAGIGGVLLSLAIIKFQFGLALHLGSLGLIWFAAILSAYTLGLYVSALLPDSKRPH